MRAGSGLSVAGLVGKYTPEVAMQDAEKIQVLVCCLRVGGPEAIPGQQSSAPRSHSWRELLSRALRVQQRCFWNMLSLVICCPGPSTRLY